MKRVINGKRYDTDTADRVATWKNGYFTNDFNYCAEYLYRKKTGEYFLHGEGGALSKYATSNGGKRGSSLFGYWTKNGEDIYPLTEDMAKSWTEQYAGEDYEDIFGPVPE